MRHKPEVFIMSSKDRVANHRSRSLYIVLNQYVYMLHEPIDDNDTVIYDDVGPIYRNRTRDITKKNEIISIYIISHINIER